ncbi:MAG: tol-pal system-associated acyl-CoA thioesterase [Steroidobacteraceae bacterium]
MTPFYWTVRIYWEDTDAGGIVYHTNYIKFFERARTEWLRHMGLTQSVLSSDLGLMFSIVGLRTDFKRPARLDDELTVSCEFQAEGGASVRFQQRIWRGGPQGELLAEGETRVACLDVSTFKPKRLPDLLRKDLSR